MSVLDIIDKKKKELKELRASDPSKYIAKMTEGFDSLKSFLDVKGEVKGQEVAEPVKSLYKSKPESLIETLVAETRKSNQQLLIIAEEATKQRKLADKNQYLKPKPNAPVVVNQGGQGGGLMDLLPGGAGVGGKIAGAGKWLGRAGGVAALAGGAYMAYDALTDDKLSSEEKSTKVGGAVGTTAGGVGGMWAGAAAGAALGSVVPVIGTAVGGIVGGLVGGVGGGFLGDTIGEKVGTYMHNDLAPAVSKTMSSVALSVDKTTQNIGDNFNTLSDQARDVFGGLSEATKSMKEGFSKGWEDLSKGGIDSFSKLKEAWFSGSGLLGGIKNVVNAVPGAASSLTSGTSKAFSSVSGAANDAASIFKGSIDTASARTSASTLERKSAVEQALTDKGIVDPKARAIMMANMDHESGGFTKASEGLNYSSVDRIKSTFAGNKALSGMNDEQIKTLVNNPEKLANTVYGNRMGNTEEGDGYKYRGRGAVQITGKDEYDRIGKKLGVDLINNPDLLLDPKIGAKASVEFLSSKKGLMEAATTGNVDKVRQLVNGGQNGAEDVKSKIAKYENSYIANPVVAKSDTKVLSPTSLIASTPQTTIIPGQPGSSAKASTPQTTPTALAEAPKSIVDRNPITAQQTVAVSNLPQPEPQTTQQPQVVSQSQGAKPRLSDIPLHITDQGLVLVQTGII